MAKGLLLLRLAKQEQRFNAEGAAFSRGNEKMTGST